MKITEVKKKNGTTVYRASVYLGVDSVTGKKVKTSVTGRTKKEVKQKAKQAGLDFKQEGETRYKSVNLSTYQELADLWLESYKLSVKPQSYDYTYRLVKNYLLPPLGNMKLGNITASYIQTIINDLSKKIVNFKLCHSINSRILRYGVFLQLLPFNPARDIILPKVRKNKRKALKYIADEDLKKLFSYMKELALKKYDYYYDYVLYSVLLATGCRFGEIAALEWSDIDFKENTVSISKNYNRIFDTVGTPKSQAGIRIISIDKKTVNLLRLYKNRQQQLFLELGARVPSMVFSTLTQDYMNLATRQTALDRRLKEINIPRFTFHAFRHTHASLLLNAGISYKELQHRLGHANINMTLDIYSHLSKDKEKDAVLYYEKAVNFL